MIRDRESLLRGYERELALVGTTDKERTAAIRAEIARVKALPPVPVTSDGMPTAAEVSSARTHAYLEGLRGELKRAAGDKDRAREISTEIARVEAGIKGTPTVERARNVPTSERAVREPGITTQGETVDG
jgi:hypothetical protein